MSQQNKTTLQSAINTQLADNTSGDISAADIRDNLINITDSLLFNTGSGQAITGSLIVTEGITGSLQGTASYATQALSASWAPAVASNPFPFTGSAVISGSLTITGSINSTGSVILGRPDFLGNRNLNISFNNENETVSLGAGLGINSKTNRISFDTITGTSNIAATSSIGLFAPTTNIVSPITNITGSLTVTGSQTITGSLIVTGGITGSLQGTATTASYVQTAQTASFLNVGTYSITSSWAVSASQALTASQATSASYALSASYAPASSPYSVYTALLSLSSGTFTVTQLQNTIGDGTNTSPNDIQWSNPANGVLRGIKSGSFNENTKLIIFVPSLRLSSVSYFVAGGLSAYFDGSVQYAPTLNITRHDNDQTSTPNFTNLPIEIRVYN
jgi:phage baseplate assembly protein gpV